MRVFVRNLQKRIPINPQRIIKTVLKILSEEGIKKSGEITICLVNDRKIKGLNLRYLGKNNPTDVIAFDISGPKSQDKICADIVISTDRAIANARIYKTSPLEELYLYVAHGTLHLLGYADKSKKNRLIIRQKEEFLLKTLNLSPITYHL